MIDVRDKNLGHIRPRAPFRKCHPLYRLGEIEVPAAATRAPVDEHTRLCQFSRRVFISCLTMVVDLCEAYTLEGRKQGDVRNNIWQGKLPAGCDPEFNRCCSGPLSGSKARNMEQSNSPQQPPLARRFSSESAQCSSKALAVEETRCRVVSKRTSPNCNPKSV